MDYHYRQRQTFAYKGVTTSVWLDDAPPAKLEKPIKRRWRVLDPWYKQLGYVESPRDGIWVARNRIEAQAGDTVRWSQFTTLDQALCCLLGWYEQDLHSPEGPADEPDPLAPAGIIPDPRAAAVPAGIALRDWFAGMALAGRMSREDAKLTTDRTHARRAYEAADAMMQERDRHD